MGHPKTFPEGKVPTNVGGRGIAEEIDDRGTNPDGQFRHVFSSSVSTSAATFPMGEGLDRAILNCSKITTALRWLRKSPYLSWQCSTQRQGDKRSAAADVIASNAPLRDGRHKARPASSKPLPRGSNGGRSPLGTPFSPIFRRATKDGAHGVRRISRAAGKTVKTKKITPRRSDLMLQRGAFCFVVQYETKGRKRVYIKVKENLSD